MSQYRVRRNRQILRNKIIRFVEKSWGEILGCRVIPGHAVFHKEGYLKKYRKFSNLIIGHKYDGRAIFVYPHPTQPRGVTRNLAKFMSEAYDSGCIVGVARDTADFWDIVIDNPTEYKRKARTYCFRVEEKKDEEE